MSATGFADLPAFVQAIEDHLGVTLAGADADALLGDDLGLDSLAMIEILVLLEDTGVVLPDDLIPELRTLGDLHHYAVVLAS
jgi:acyl carrier protein